ncbi:hypothetical protein C6A87_020170 [Mycobacterium sp. ITM-2016-00317]|uniref:hypothetical protein n=1 Tax=Mycobacterium sp. ITM-2016-00317 TaxID=2099694 RepID=UPI00287F887A|nr:hypothetical protein [Mycobacterium sp. ITM-2016-00317]WNG86173.1 hypothetical protein C6A87_020170 [Mycobacterium sp. ITM-2016-00317]
MFCYGAGFNAFARLRGNFDVHWVVESPCRRVNLGLRVVAIWPRLDGTVARIGRGIVFDRVLDVVDILDAVVGFLAVVAVVAGFLAVVGFLGRFDVIVSVNGNFVGGVAGVRCARRRGRPGIALLRRFRRRVGRTRARFGTGDSRALRGGDSHSDTEGHRQRTYPADVTAITVTCDNVHRSPDPPEPSTGAEANFVPPEAICANLTH